MRNRVHREKGTVGRYSDCAKSEKRRGRRRKEGMKVQTKDRREERGKMLIENRGPWKGKEKKEKENGDVARKIKDVGDGI